MRQRTMLLEGSCKSHGTSGEESDSLEREGDVRTCTASSLGRAAVSSSALGSVGVGVAAVVGSSRVGASCRSVSTSSRGVTASRGGNTTGRGGWSSAGGSSGGGRKNHCWSTWRTRAVGAIRHRVLARNEVPASAGGVAGIAVGILVTALAATNAVLALGRLEQGEELAVTIAPVSPSVRVHLSTTICGAQLPGKRVEATCDLNISGSLVLEEVGRENDVLGHLGVGSELLGFLGGGGVTNAVGGSAGLRRSHLTNTHGWEHGAEVVLVNDSGDVVANLGNLAVGGLLSQDGDSRGSEEEEDSRVLPDHG